jgi:hypothetical protein
MIEKIHVLLKCEHCQGKAYLPEGEAEDYRGRKYIRYKPCPICEGSGMAAKWITLSELSQLLKKVECAHEHIASTGEGHSPAGEVWDDIQEVCSDCGKVLG